MKYIYIALLFLGLCTAQAESYQILWNTPSYNYSHTGKRILSLDFEGQHDIDDAYKVGNFKINLVGQVSDLKFSNVLYVPCSQEENDILNKDLFKTSIVHEIVEASARNQIHTSIEVLPIVKGKDGLLYKIKSFELKFTKSAVKATTTSLARTAITSSSVLNKGDWYKISVGDAGVFKVDYNFLKGLGLSVDQLDPHTLQIFGFGGMLPEKNSDFRYDDLPEIPVKFVGNTDTKFDANEYILVYLQGPNSLSYGFVYNYLKNIYSDKAFYFITHSQANHKTINPKIQRTSFDNSYDSYDFVHRHEIDQVTFIPSGRKWWGESLAQNPSLVFNVPIPELVEQTYVSLSGRIAGSNSQATLCNISFNGIVSTSYTLDRKPPIEENTYTEVRDFEFGEDLPASSVGNNYNLSIQYGRADFNKKTHLDYFQIEATAKLILKDNFLLFRNKEIINTGISQFKLKSSKTNIEIWDVTTIDQVSKLTLDQTNDMYTFIDSASNNSQYVALDMNGGYSNPTAVGKVDAQNLHAEQTPELLIITHTSLKGAADELANFRRTHNGYNVSVVTTDKIYNEFSSGAQDLMALRDYIKLLYWKDPSKLKWVLLFGACSYDYKDRIANNTNFVPIYEMLDSYNIVSSYSSDDFIGFLDPNEGGDIKGGLDVAIGRIPVRNLAEGQAAVKKLVYYGTDKHSMDSWKNNISFACDDGDYNSHLTASEDLVNTANTYNKFLKVNKLYLPLFPEIPSPVGQTSPVLNQRIINDVERGTFILNYSGHGREIGWAGENIITLETIKNFKNIDKLFLLIAGTCEFGRYDAPEINSGVQEAFFNPNGGAIATIAATRPVYAAGNKDLNESILRYVYEKRNGSYRTLGEILQEAKMDYFQTTNSKSYALLGDPSMSLNYPKYDVAIDSIISDANQVMDTIKALSKITIKGSVTDAGTVLKNFDGEVTLILYDKEFEKLTKYDSESEKYVKPENSKSIEKKVNVRESIIYQGKVEVKNGLFSVSFIIPKDISYVIGKGLILSYAKNKNSDLDAWGGSSKFFIGDSEDDASTDNTAPIVKAYINDTTFKDGGSTSNDIIFLARLSDESGINLSRTAVGHEIVLILDGQETNRYIINEYYISDQNSFNKGSIKYPLYGLAPGKHTLTIKVWDVYNNSSEQSVTFEVIGGNKLQIGELYALSSPEQDQQEFSFSHNRAGENLEAEIQIVDAQGRLVKQLSARIPEANSVVTDIAWQTKANNNQYGANIGLYIYKLVLRSEHDGATDSKTAKLVFTK